MNNWCIAYKAGTGRAWAHPQTFATRQAAQDFLDRHGWDHMHPVEAE